MSMLDFFCVEKCRICHEFLTWNKAGPFTLCPSCLKDIQIIPTVEEKDGITVLYALDYDAPTITQLMRRLKYHNDELVADDLALLIEPALKEFLQDRPVIPHVVPVPLHWTKAFSRGYNQAALIAEPLCERLGLFYDPDMLKRSRKTKPHHGLDKQERAVNVQSAFRARPASHPFISVMIVDDIFTSGATIIECAQTLKAAGYHEVFALTAARAA